MNHAYKLLDELLKRHLVLSCLFNFSEGLAIKKGSFKKGGVCLVSCFVFFFLLCQAYLY